MSAGWQGGRSLGRQMKREHGFSARFRLKTVYHCFDVSVIRQKSNVFFFFGGFCECFVSPVGFCERLGVGERERGAHLVRSGSYLGGWRAPLASCRCVERRGGVVGEGCGTDHPHTHTHRAQQNAHSPGTCSATSHRGEGRGRGRGAGRGGGPTRPNASAHT